MAITWGAYVNNDTGNGMRLGYEFSQSPSSVGSGTSSVTVSLKIWVETKAPVSDSSNSLTLSGSWNTETSPSINHGTGGGTTLVRDLSRTVSTSYTSTGSTSFTVSLNGINAIPGTATVSGSWTTAKRPFKAPTAPSGVSLLLSGSGGLVRWTRRPSTSAPYDNIELDFQRDDGSWQDSATLSGSASSYTTNSFMANASYQYRVRAINSSGTSAWAYSNTVKTKPNAPAAPSNAVITRSSDTRQVLTWTRGADTSTAPRSQHVIARRDVLGANNWINIATVSGSTSSFTDSSTVANKQYQYRVQAKNAGGTSSWATSEYMSTTPKPPTSVKAKKLGEDIQVTWANTTGTRITGIEVWLTADGADQTPVYLLLSGSPTSWTHVSPDSSKTWAYRLKTQSGADTNDAAPNLYSAFSARTNTVQLQAPPSAPSLLKPSSSAIDATDENIFTWQHNAVDTTDQTGYELRYRVDGGAWVTITDMASGFSRRTFAADTFTNGSSLEWQVRTWGAHADPSPWSSIAVVTVSSRPSVTIVSPDGSAGIPVIDSSSITVDWDYFDPENTTQTSVRLSLQTLDGETVWATTRNMASTAYTIPYRIADGASYVLVVSVRDGSGLWSYETTQQFSVTYSIPPVPLLAAIWDLDLGGVVINIDHPAPGLGESEVVSADLQHSANGADWSTIATGLDPSTATVDFIPTLDTVNYYRVISYSALPSSVESQSVPVLVESKGWVFVNGGSDWSTICRIRDNVQTGHSPKRAKVLNHFAGRKYPVMTSGEARDYSVTISGRTSGGGSTDDEWQALYDDGEPVCYREPGPAYRGSGDRFIAAFQDYSRSRERNIEQVSMSFERVEEV